MVRPILHSINGSPFGCSVQLALDEKGVAYDCAYIQVGEHKLPAHLARHPFGRVPVLEHDGFVLYETQAILRYVDRAFDGPPLQPGDLRGLARMDQILNIMDWYMVRSITGVIGFNRIIKPRFLKLPPDEQAIDEILPLARTTLAELDRLKGEAPYLVGEQATLADFHIAPHIGYLLMTPEAGLFSAYPRLGDWWARISERPGLRWASAKAA